MRVSGLRGTSRPIRVNARRKTPRALSPTRSTISCKLLPCSWRSVTSTSTTLPGMARSISSASIALPITGRAATMAAVAPTITTSSPAASTTSPRGSISVPPRTIRSTGAAANLVLDFLYRAAGGVGNAIRPRLEFPVRKVLALWRRAAGKLSLELGRLVLQVHAHQPGRNEGHEQQGEDVAEHIGEGVTGSDIRRLLIENFPASQVARARRMPCQSSKTE